MALEQWVQNGPMRGAYFPGSGPGAANCLDPKVLAVVEKVAETGGLIMQHTWLKAGGKRSPHESAPAELAILASRYQSSHSSVLTPEDEQGIRAFAYPMCSLKHQALTQLPDSLKWLRAGSRRIVSEVICRPDLWELNSRR